MESFYPLDRIISSYLILVAILWFIILQALFEIKYKYRTYYICENCLRNFVLNGFRNPDSRCPFCSSYKLHVIIAVANKEQEIKGMVWNPPQKERKPLLPKEVHVGTFLCILFLTVAILAYGYYDYFVRKKSVSIGVILNLRNFNNRTALIEVYDLNSSSTNPSSWEIANFSGHLDIKRLYDSGKVLLIKIIILNNSIFNHVIEAKHFTIVIPYLTQSEISDLIQIETNYLLTIPPPSLSIMFDLDWNYGVVERV